MKRFKVLAGISAGLLSGLLCFNCLSACDSTEYKPVNYGISEDAPHYSMKSTNLALLSNCYIEVEELSEDSKVLIHDSITGEVKEDTMDCSFRYIRSFDEYLTMLDYSSYNDVYFNDTALQYMQDNWETDYYFDMEE